MTLLPTLLLLFALPALASGAPMALTSATFLPVPVAARAKAESWGASKEELKTQPRVHFVSPGVLDVSEGGRTMRCHFEGDGAGYLWSLRLRCDDEVTLRRYWTWLPGGRVSTDLLEGGDPLTRVELPEESPSDEVGVSVKEVHSVEDAPLVGLWSSWDQKRFDIRKDGAVVLDGYSARAEVGECANDQVPEMPRVPCLWFQSATGARIAFGLLAADVLVEGRLTVAERDELRFEGFRGGRAFRR